MAGDWPVVCLRELCDPVRGITYGIVQPGTSIAAGIPILRADDVDNGRIITSNVMRVAPAIESSYARLRLRGGEVLLTLVGAYFGKAAVAREEHAGFNTARAVGVIPVLQSADYVAYALRGADCQAFIRTRATTTAQPTLNLRDVGEIPIPWPSSEIRAKITANLRALDDKIELNRGMNETLEAIARTLFRSWFVDFDPVRAKAEGRDAGLPPPLADLFPDSFEDSELGAIPKGWTVRGLDEIARFLNGLALQKYPPKDGPALPVIKIAQLRAESTEGADYASAELPSDYIVEDGDVLFSWSGSLECVLWASGKGALNQHLFKVTSSEYPKWLYYLWVHRHLNEFRQIAASKATTMGHIQRHHLSAAKIVLPPAGLLRVADRHFGPIIGAIPRNLVHSRTLRELRDALLPKLISGEIRIAAIKRPAPATQ